jgi:hypothetical protein
MRHFIAVFRPTARTFNGSSGKFFAFYEFILFSLLYSRSVVISRLGLRDDIEKLLSDQTDLICFRLQSLGKTGGFANFGNYRLTKR